MGKAHSTATEQQRALTEQKLQDKHTVRTGFKHTFVIVQSGIVWVRILSPHRYPLIDISCTLHGGSRSFPMQNTDRNGTVSWDDLPLDAYFLRMSLGDRTAQLAVPWLREKDVPHEQIFMEASKLLDSSTSLWGIQVRLRGLDYDCGGPSGCLDTKTQEALMRFQTDLNLESTGMPDIDTGDVLARLFGA